MSKARIELPPKLVPVLSKPRGAFRYRGAYGGRGSGKSYGFALMAAVFGYVEPLRILCARELQVSIKDSIHAELKRTIESYPWLAAHYDIGESYITGKNGTEFLFRGLRHNISSIKSMVDIGLCLIDEAEYVSERSLQWLLPTIRAENSEAWFVWNPELEGSPVDLRFRKEDPDDASIVELEYWDNPWFPSVLEKQRQYDQRRLDPNVYSHIWEGAYLKNTESQVLQGKVFVRPFEPTADWNGPYYGLDYGFANDPTAAVECYVYEDRLYIRREAGGKGIEIDHVPELLKRELPGIERHIVRAESANPGTTSYLRRHGIEKIQSVKKWDGSIEDGVRHLRSYSEIVIHPECKETIRESRLYSYKVDKLTGDVLPTIIDAYNNYIDAIRYALAPLIRNTANVPSTAGGRIF